MHEYYRFMKTLKTPPNFLKPKINKKRGKLSNLFFEKNVLQKY